MHLLILGKALNNLALLTPGILMPQAAEKGKKEVKRGRERQRTAEKMGRKEGKGSGMLGL